MPLEPAWKPNILKLRCSKIIKDQAASNSPPLASASLALSAAIQLSSLWHPWPKPAIWLPLRLYSVFLSGTSTALVMGSAGKCLQYEMASTTNCTTCSRPPVCHSSIQEMSPTEFVWKKIQFPKIEVHHQRNCRYAAILRHSSMVQWLVLRHGPLMVVPMAVHHSWTFFTAFARRFAAISSAHRLNQAGGDWCDCRGRLMGLLHWTINHIYMLCTHTYIYYVYITFLCI